MPHETYITKRFEDSTLDMIAHVQCICNEYMTQGFTLTLRQLYYQLVTRELVHNTQREYKRIGRIVTDGRLTGLIDWSAIEDRTRSLNSAPHWTDPPDLLDSVKSQFAIDKWMDQPHRIEVWIEKDALTGIIEPVCRELDISYFACRGYASQSELWRASKRFEKYQETGQDVVIIHLGDHDPAGMDMTRDNEDRLTLFNTPVVMRRIALNMDQVITYGLPPNPTKLTDSRAGEYMKRFGHDSWELDAVEPKVISDFICDEVFRYRDHELWDKACEREADMQEFLADVTAAATDDWELR